MNSASFDKIAANGDILIHIFNLLDFEDQLRLSQVNYNTKYIFENSIWKETYRCLAIYEKDDCFEVTNGEGANRLLLTENVLQEFIAFYGKEVQELYTKIPVAHLAYFANLTSLRCTLRWPIMRVFLKPMAQSLPQLEILEWEETMKYAYLGPAAVIDSEVVECLMQMTNLKQLSFRANRHFTSIEYESFNQLIYEMKLQVLKLVETPINLTTKKPFERHSVKKFKNSVQLQELDLFQPSNFWKLHAGHFEKLTILRLCLDGQSIHNRDLKEMSTKCPNLERLSFMETNFCSINSCILPPKLSEFHFKECYALKYQLLKQILTQTTTIKVFTFTDFCGNFEDFEPFEISPSIHTVAIEGIDMSKFQLSLQLQHLRKISVKMDDLNDWSFLVDLLKHPPLRELHLSRFVEQENLVPISGFPTKVTTLSIDFVVIPGSALQFFLDLFKQNPDMQLSFSVGRWTWRKTLKFLLNHKKCPNDLETMQVCDFKINYTTFMRNFEMAAKKFRCDFEDYDFDRKDIIVLYRHF